jgi:hypothetical protein
MEKKEMSKIFVGKNRKPFEMPEGFSGSLQPIPGGGFMVVLRKYEERTLVPECRGQEHKTIFNDEGNEIAHVEVDTDWQPIPASNA